jgi:starch phosphorylase
MHAVVETIHVRPALPGRLKALEALAYGLRWSWDHDTINLPRWLDRPRWDVSGHLSVLMLESIAQQRLQEVAEDAAVPAHLDSVAAGLRDAP